MERASEVRDEPPGGGSGPAGRPGPMDRLLHLFSDVRAGEGLTALLLMLDVFLLLGGYYLLKTIREPLILAVKESGAEYKAYSNAATAALLLVLVPAYSALASRTSRAKLINFVTLFFIVCLLGFYAWAQAVGAGAPTAAGPGAGAAAADAAATSASRLWLGIAFFVWVGIFNVMIIAQAWAFANDVYTVEQGKRLFPIVALGASLGAIAGAYATKPLIEALGVSPLMLVTSAVLASTLFLTLVISARARRAVRPELAVAPAAAPGAAPAVEPRADAGREDERIRGRSGFALVFSDRYLLLIAVLTMMLNLVNTTGEYILGERVSEIAEARAAAGALGAGSVEEWIGLFYGDYFFWVNIASAVLQAFFVSRIIRLIGVRGSLMVVPLISLGGYIALAFTPILGLIRGVKLAENSLDYSLGNTSRHALFLPTSRDAKYKAKQATDTFFWRFGDLISAGVVFAGVTWLSFATQQFALVNTGLVVLWLLAAFVVGRGFRERARTD